MERARIERNGRNYLKRKFIQRKKCQKTKRNEKGTSTHTHESQGLKTWKVRGSFKGNANVENYGFHVKQIANNC